MIRPAGFAAIDGGWGRPAEGHWRRSLPNGIWQYLTRSQTDGGWQVGLFLDAPATVLGRQVPTWARRGAAYLASHEFPDQTTARQWLDAHRTPYEVAAALSDGTALTSAVMNGEEGSATPLLDAVSVLIVGGHLAAARSLLLSISGLTAPAADRAAQLVAVAGDVSLPHDGVMPADTADVLALLTRTISADLALARAHRWARRWLPTAHSDGLRLALAAVQAAPSPPNEAAAVTTWQLHLEHIRATVADPTSGGWPTTLPGVAENLMVPQATPAQPRRRIDTDRSFAVHAGHCPHGAPSDGRTRVDVFFDYSAFPVWTAGGGCMTNPHRLGLPPDLAADLWSWSSSHDRRAVPGSHSRPGDNVARHEQARLRLLASRLEHATGHAAVVNQPRGRGNGTCATPRCLGPKTRTRMTVD